MLPRRAVPVCLVVLVSLLCHASPVTPADAAQWREDLHYFAEHAPLVHKNLFHSMTREQFDAAVKHLDERIPTLSRNQIVVEITRIVAMIGDGHTYAELNQPPTNFRHYPLKLYWFSDGVYVLKGDKKYAAAVGGRIVKLGKVSGKDAYDAVSKVVPHDNEFQIRWMTPFYMSLAEMLDGLGLVDNLDAVPLTVEKDGVQTTVILKPEAGDLSLDEFVLPADWVDARDPVSPQPLWQKDPVNYYWFTYLADSRTLYVQFNAVLQKPDETIETFFKRVMAFADAHPVDHFVLDERLNGGGNNFLLRPIIHGFIRSDTVNQPGKLFTVIGRQTFSAAMNCVNRMNLNTNTLFVGEPTGSSPNQYGDNAPVVQTVDNNTYLTTGNAAQTHLYKAAIASGHLTTKGNPIQGDCLVDIFLTDEGAEQILTPQDKQYCKMAVEMARKSIAENDGEPHPYVGAVVVKDGKILATGYRGETGEGRHAEFCALKKVNDDVDIRGGQLQ